MYPDNDLGFSEFNHPVGKCVIFEGHKDDPLTEASKFEAFLLYNITLEYHP